MKDLSRRGFVHIVAAASPTLIASGISVAAAPRALQLRHLHTGERLEAEYWSGGHYRPDALAAVNRLLRDFRTNDVAEIDPRLLDLLHALSRLTGASGGFEVISGYRSARTNEELRRRGGGGVASRSLHMDGRAIDIRLAGVGLTALRDAALSLEWGGVGHYPESNFVHVDTGRVRRW